jgi:hypothetical protein
MELVAFRCQRRSSELSANNNCKSGPQKGIPEMGIRERSSKRRKRIVAHRASSFQDAEKWDLDFWKRQTPEQRLSALVAIRRDVMKVKQARMKNDASEKEEPQ